MAAFPTTNYPNGVTNAALNSTLQTLTQPDPTGLVTFWDDFFKFNAVATTGAADWVTNTTGTSTAVVGDELGGVVTFSNTGGADNDVISAQWKGFDATTDVAEIFKIDPAQDFWFKTRFKLSDATQSDALIGLVSTNTTPITAVVNGIYFLKPDDAAVLNLVLTKASTSTTIASIATMTDATYLSCGFHYNPFNGGAISVYVNDVRVAGTTTLTNLPTVTLAPTFAVQNGAAAAKSMSLDYIFAATTTSR